MPYTLRQVFLTALLFAATSHSAVALDAEKKAEIGQAFRDGVSGKYVDGTRLDALIAQSGFEDGVVPVGIFEGKLEPIPETFSLKIPASRSFVCTTDIESNLPQAARQGSLLDSEEHVRIDALDGGRKHVILETVDSEATVGLDLIIGNDAAELQEFWIVEADTTERFKIQDDGSMLDENSGVALHSGSADLIALTGMADLAVAANPFWHASDTTLTVGE